MTTPLIEEIARGLCRDGGLCVGFCHKQRCYSAIAAYGTQAQAALAVITEAGYAIVPVEPTEGMLANEPCPAEAEGIWRAMIAATHDHIMPAIQTVGPLDSEKGE